jgi:hypothetical protein
MKTHSVAFLLLLLFSAQGTAQICTPDATNLCLLGNRFEVDMTWMDVAGTSGDGHAVAMTDEWGYFWYTDPRYIDAAVKVLNGCGINARFWVSATLLSDYQQTLNLTDTNHSVVKSYFNPLGIAPPAITDTGTFATCDGGKTLLSRITTVASQTSFEFAGHFQIAVEWKDFGSGTGTGTGVSLTSHSGYFWFFSPNNPELFIKLVDDYADTGYFWVVFGATTNVEFTVTVTNTEDGQILGYFNPLGNTPSTVIHRQAFVSSTVFADAFESGDTTAWSNTTP